MLRVVLDWDEVRHCADMAREREVLALQNKRRGGFEPRGLGLDENWQGCLGEYAACKHLGVDWEPLSFAAIDAGFAEVRTVTRLDSEMALYPKDSDGLPFIRALVTRRDLPAVWLTGWILGAEGKRPEHWRQLHSWGAPAFFVPNRLLRPMVELPRPTTRGGDHGRPDEAA